MSFYKKEFTKKILWFLINIGPVEDVDTLELIDLSKWSLLSKGLIFEDEVRAAKILNDKKIAYYKAYWENITNGS